MKIAIDARFYNPENRGLSCYTRHLVHGLEKIDSKNEYFILLRDKDYATLQFRNPNFTKIRAEAHWYTVKEQFALPYLLKKIKPDLTHFPHFNIPLAFKGKFVTTIHDLILLKYPTKRATTLNRFAYFLKDKGYQITIRQAVRKSARIIAVSSGTAKDIKESFPEMDRRKIVVIGEGCGESNSKTIKKYAKYSISEQKKRLVEKFGINKKFILYLGGAYPHKNLERLVLAFHKTGLKKTCLVLGGGNDYFFKRLKDFVSQNKIKNVIFPGFLRSKKDLEFLYSQADFCIFPSLYEGFGLPPLEALKRNKAILCSNNTVFPEVLKKSAIYFNGLSVSDMAKKILLMSKNRPIVKPEIIKKTLKSHSWQKMCREILDIYENA